MASRFLSHRRWRYNIWYHLLFTIVVGFIVYCEFELKVCVFRSSAQRRETRDSQEEIWKMWKLLLNKNRKWQKSEITIHSIFISTILRDSIFEKKSRKNINFVLRMKEVKKNQFVLPNYLWQRVNSFPIFHHRVNSSHRQCVITQNRKSFPEKNYDDRWWFNLNIFSLALTWQGWKIRFFHFNFFNIFKRQTSSFSRSFTATTLQPPRARLRQREKLKQQYHHGRWIEKNSLVCLP